MTWYGQNRSGRTTPWEVGDLVRYDYGPTALMRIEAVRDMGPDQEGCRPQGMNRWRYYGRAFHSTDCCTGRYHGQCLEPTQKDLRLWAATHDENDQWTGHYPTIDMPKGGTIESDTTEHPPEPVGDEPVRYRGWEAHFSWQHEYWTGHGYCAYLGGPDLDCTTLTAATWADLLEQIDDYEAFP